MYFLLIMYFAAANGQPFDTIYSWDRIDYNFPNQSTRDAYMASGDFIPENNVPLGFNIWGNKMFVTVSRWKSGVASNLNYFWMNDSSSSPVLTPYPDLETNDIRKPDSIVDIFRIRVDACDRLWGLDTGIDNILGDTKVVQPMKLVVIDLKTDKIIRSYPLKDTDQKPDSFIAELAIDVDPNSCDDAYAYLPDFGAYGLVVYSWAKNDSWRIEHNYFHFDPLNGDYNVSGINFQWTDGVFGLSLSPMRNDGHRTLYFHAMSGVTEFSVSTAVLKDETLARASDYYAFRVVGDRGPRTQSSTSMIDEQTGINYFTQVNRNGVACWDTETELNPHTFVLAMQDDTTMVFPNDLLVHPPTEMLYVLSNNLPRFMNNMIDGTSKKYFITAAPLQQLAEICRSRAVM